MSEKNPEAVVARLQTTLTSEEAVQDASFSKAAGKATGDADSNTIIRSLGDLKKKAPEVYDQLLKGIAQNIISQMKHSQERISEMWKEMRNK